MPRRDDEDDFDDDRPRKAKPRRRDDDDFDDAPRRRPAKPDTASRVMLIIAGTVVVIFLGCGGLAWYIFSSVKSGVQQVQKDMGQTMDKMREENERRMKEEQDKRAKLKVEAANSDFGVARKSANELWQNVIGRRYDAIRTMGTAKFQERMTEDAIKSLIEANAGGMDSIREFRDTTWGDEPKTGSLFTFTEDFIARNGGGFQSVKVTMVKEGTAWKVDQFLIEKKQ